MNKIIALYGGSFKFPTKGHFEVVSRVLREFPEIDELKIIVGSGVRDGVTQEQSTKIWNIYKNYFSPKLKIETSVSPIGDIIRFIKKNPEDLIYFILGARQGNENDKTDIKNRTKDLEEKYSNVLIKIIITQDKEMRGTKARKAKEIEKYLPDELTDKEIQNIKNILTGKDNIKELFNPRNKYALNENATYSNHIDIVSYIDKLTEFLLHIYPQASKAPQLVWVNSDTENATKFTGKTAFYDPNEKSIYIYTEGRHPKDIGKSYSHEWIHYIQDLKGRLNNITTTNTNEDDNLNNLEKEAYLEGNINFRNWIDSLKENPTSLNEMNFSEELTLDPIDRPNEIKYWALYYPLFKELKYGNKSYKELRKKYKNEFLKALEYFHDLLKQGEFKDYKPDTFGLNQYTKELAEEIINEGIYDNIITQLSNKTLKYWKNDFELGKKESELFDEYFFTDSKGRPLEFEYKATIKFNDTPNEIYVVDGGSDSGKKTNEIGYITLDFEVDRKNLPNFWSDISMDLADCLRHEIEHLTQEGINQTKTQEIDPEVLERELINTQLLPQKYYYLLKSEIDPMLQGMYLKAKKTKKPFKEIVDEYLERVGLTNEEKEEVLKVWRKKTKKLSLPL